MTVSGPACGCGEPAVARGMCRGCYAAWYKATNPYKKRNREPTAAELWLRRRIRHQR